jgi:hypothetical protein
VPVFQGYILESEALAKGGLTPQGFESPRLQVESSGSTDIVGIERDRRKRKRWGSDFGMLGGDRACRAVASSFAKATEDA